MKCDANVREIKMIKMMIKINMIIISMLGKIRLKKYKNKKTTLKKYNFLLSKRFE